MKETVKGLIIKRTPFKENDMLLTVLTAEKGKMNVLARGLRKSRRDLSGYQTLAYAELEIFDGRGLAVVDDAEVCEAFEGLRKDIESLALAQYFADAVAFVTTDKGDPELLRLLLNSLALLSEAKAEKLVVKTVFELRFALEEGFAPSGGGCAVCGKTPAFWSFSQGLLCEKCAHGDGFSLSNDELMTVNHILTSSGMRTYRLPIGTEELSHLSGLTEKYLEYHLEHRFESLDYYKQFENFGK
jgi:DNA repair protein RecO (recombination protein O)